MPFGTGHSETCQITCKPSEDLEQPEHARIQIKVFAVGIKMFCIHAYLHNANRRRVILRGSTGESGCSLCARDFVSFAVPLLIFEMLSLIQKTEAMKSISKFDMKLLQANCVRNFLLRLIDVVCTCILIISFDRNMDAISVGNPRSFVLRFYGPVNS